MGHLRKLYPNESGSWDRFDFVRWYVDKDVSLESAEEVEYLVGWGYKVSMMDLQREIFLRIHSPNMKRDQKRIFLKEGSSLQPLRQVRSAKTQLQKTRDRLGSDRGAILGDTVASD